LHVRRVKNGKPSVRPLRGDEIRALRELHRQFPDSGSRPKPNSPGSAIVVQFPSDDEIAQIIARGVTYQDWETVMVQLRWHSDYDPCRFTAVRAARAMR
jgi:hypothetical protein